MMSQNTILKVLRNPGMGKHLIFIIQNGHQISIICCISALKWPIRVIPKFGKVFLTQEGILDGTKFNNTTC